GSTRRKQSSCQASAGISFPCFRVGNARLVLHVPARGPFFSNAGGFDANFYGNWWCGRAGSGACVKGTERRISLSAAFVSGYIKKDSSLGRREGLPGETNRD